MISRPSTEVSPSLPSPATGADITEVGVCEAIKTDTDQVQH